MKRGILILAAGLMAAGCADDPTQVEMRPANIAPRAAVVGNGASTASNDGASNLAIPLPSGAKAGDLLLAQVSVGDLVYATDAVCAPAGWTLAARSPAPPTNGWATTGMFIFYRLADGHEGATATFGISGDGCATAAAHRKATGGIRRYSGVNANNPIRNAAISFSFSSRTPAFHAGIGDEVVSMFGFRSPNPGADVETEYYNTLHELLRYDHASNGYDASWSTAEGPAIVAGDWLVTDPNGESRSWVVTGIDADWTAQVVVAHAAFATTLTSWGLPDNAVFGQGVALITQVSASDNGQNRDVVGGRVKFYLGGTCQNPGTPLGEAGVFSGAQATLQRRSLLQGTNHIVVCYTDATGSYQSASGAFDYNMTPAPENAFPTTTSVTPSASTIQFGQPLTFTATVAEAGYDPSTDGDINAFNVPFDGGQMTFIRKGTCEAPGEVLGTVNMTGFTASFTTTSLPTGLQSISACYHSVTGNFYISGGSTEALIISTPTQTTLSITPSTGADNETPLTLTANVSYVAGGVFFGTVNFYRDATTCGEGTLIGTAGLNNGVAALTNVKLPPGPNLVRACFPGVSGTWQSSSAGTTFQVNIHVQQDPFVSITTLTADPPSSTVGTPVVLNAYVTRLSGVAVNVGAVTFLKSGTCAAPGAVAGSSTVLNGSASATLFGLAAGHHDLTACFNATGYVPSSATLSYDVAALNHAPVITSTGGPYNGVQGSSIAFNGSATDQDNDALTYTWDFPDGSTATGASVSHTLFAAGAFNVMLTVTDGRGGQVQTSVSGVVANVAPTATLTAPASVLVDETIAFELANAVDVPNDLAGLQYSFSCDFLHDTWGGYGADSHSTCAAPAAGTMTVGARVRDGTGGESTYHADVPVIQPNRAPVITSNGGPYAMSEGVASTFTAAATDADNDALTYAWSFGDGATAAGASASHTYSDNGSYDVTLTVTDARGLVSTSHTTAVVSNVAPTGVLVANGPAYEGVKFVFSVTGVTDVPADASTLQFAYSCDGANYSNAPITVQWQCVPRSFGVLNMGVRVTDKDGGTTTYTRQITVLNVAPVVTADRHNAEILAGDTLLARATFADGGEYELTDAPYTGTVDFGDGTVVTTANPFRSFKAPHAYARAGTYTVRFSVTDGGGMTGTDTEVVVVVGAAAASVKLQAMIDAQVAAGALASNDAKPLQSSLDAARKSYDSGNTKAASNQIDAFINKVEAMIKSGRISAANGNALIDYAKKIQAMKS